MDLNLKTVGTELITIPQPPPQKKKYEENLKEKFKLIFFFKLNFGHFNIKFCCHLLHVGSKK